MSRSAEVRFGESKERAVLRRWLDLCRLEPGHVVKLGQFDDLDFLLLDDVGMPLAYVEIKVRRRALRVFIDAIFPMRKHDFAKEVLGRFGVRCFGVTLYGCGAIVEVDLASSPSQARAITRSDRKGAGAVLHALYRGDHLRIVDRGGSHSGAPA